ncbi:MAG: dynamin family protein [Gammaproteobacteria bacterium]|nr:dynamin family protein [Gammaproteobacteria bacterium]
MQDTTQSGIDERIKALTAHLKAENPALLDIVKSFRRLDTVAYTLGLLETDESFAATVPWWPLISVLGTFSAGKSTFINNYVGHRLQSTGNQAVDDKFTVICYGPEETPRILPSLALDSDPRFPFYKISQEINKETAGEGSRLDTYLQLKTCKSDRLLGRVLIDSPGFDADEQRSATLRLAKHIIDMSDLVLVFFDARHPEPGAMQDTLKHLVEANIGRSDFNKFVFILNQIDNTAREDNPEEVVAAWQRGLAQKGLTAGKFYRIYDSASAVPIEDDAVRARFEAKRDADLGEIYDRMQHLEIERSYRIAGNLERFARRIRDDFVPEITKARRAWRRRVLWLDLFLIVAVIVGGGYFAYSHGLLENPPPLPDLGALTTNNPSLVAGGAVVALLVLLGIHRLVRSFAAGGVIARLKATQPLGEHTAWLIRAFEKNVGGWKPVLSATPSGWGIFNRRRLSTVLTEADRAIQRLNNRYTNPAGGENP